ncbi:DNA gyrase inhibitor YacG [Bdellovibrio reynosensis]|uniref:DNA gyrase inhibitor YacG n=1 Tax=Bdellovibrio reynosensis TaxID=2835041 RepID=A0ABY4CB33_9BACT|nr:DNA gyrase inhibitor YacG [Bdellovibrio reynosensis]UOF00886.1 DNA gyrase inhibitor YacG [Bdellovibrio reynosensis]
MTDTKAKQVKCPQCGRLALYTPENPYRPFCSERCKLIDLGEWASEGYKIPVKPSSSDSLSIDDDYHEPSDDHSEDAH